MAAAEEREAVQVVVTDSVMSVLERLGVQLKNRKPIGEAMGLAVTSLTIRSFNDPSVRAAPWAPLKEATVAAKLREGTSTAILKRNTLLWRSWRITELTNDVVKVGTDRFYAKFHQWGTIRGLPPRPMLPLDGTPDSADFTPLAVRRIMSAARAVVQGLLGNASEAGRSALSRFNDPRDGQ